MSYKEVKGNIFNTNAMAVVNTVNCVGAMGKGIALDFKLRYPEMFREYQKTCFKHLLKPGQILPYKKSNPIILNFAIKDDWKDPSKIEWVEETLQKFVYEFDPDVPCKLYVALKEIVSSYILSISELESYSGIKSRYWIKILDAVNDSRTKSLNNLCNYMIDGKRIIGKTNIERLFIFLTQYDKGSISVSGNIFE